MLKECSSNNMYNSGGDLDNYKVMTKTEKEAILTTISCPRPLGT